ISSFVKALVTPTDNGNEVWQSLSTAKSQGYASSGNWAPTSGNCNGVSPSSCTVGTGANLTSIFNSMDNAEAASACLHGIGGVTYDSVNHVAVDHALVARGSAWD